MTLLRLCLLDVDKSRLLPDTATLTAASALTALASVSAATLALAVAATASPGLPGGAASLGLASVGLALALLTLVVTVSLGHGLHLLAKAVLVFVHRFFDMYLSPMAVAHPPAPPATTAHLEGAALDAQRLTGDQRLAHGAASGSQNAAVGLARHLHQFSGSSLIEVLKIAETDRFQLLHRQMDYAGERNALGHKGS